MPSNKTIGPETERMLERQLRQWEALRARQAAESEADEQKRLWACLSISNAVGAGGAEIADMLSRRLGWPFFGKNLLQAMAGDDEIRARIYHSMDERSLGWFEEMMRSFLDRNFSRNDYFRKLNETVLYLAEEGHTIFLGRFTDLILPRDRGLRVKVVASLEYRVANFARHAEVSLDEARSSVERIESERADFVRRHFRIEPCDNARFDLMLNSEWFTIDQAVEMILTAMRCRGMIVESADGRLTSTGGPAAGGQSNNVAAP